MSILAVPMMLAPILGPTVGGVIIQNISWRWIFYVNVPIGVIAVISALRTLPWVKPGDAGRLDLRGLVLMSGGAALLTYGLAEIGSTGSFSSTKVVAPIIGGLALVALFVVCALRVPRPLLDVRLYRRPTFSTASVAMFALAAALFGGMILLPLYWQEVRHESVIDAGLLMAPQGLGAAVAMPLAGKLSDRYGGGPVALIGVLVTTLFTIPFGLIGAHTSILYLSVMMLLRGTGIGFGMMPAMTAAFASLERSELSDATPQLNVLQRIGGSIGTAVLAVVLQRALVGAHTPPAAASAYGTAFWASAILAAVAIVPAIMLMRAERAARAAHPEVPRPRGRAGGSGGVERRAATPGLCGLDARAGSERRPRRGPRRFPPAVAPSRRLKGRAAPSARPRDPPPRRAQLRPVRAAVRPPPRRPQVISRARLRGRGVARHGRRDARRPGRVRPRATHALGVTTSGSCSPR